MSSVCELLASHPHVKLVVAGRRSFSRSVQPVVQLTVLNFVLLRLVEAVFVSVVLLRLVEAVVVSVVLLCLVEAVVVSVVLLCLVEAVVVSTEFVASAFARLLRMSAVSASIPAP